MTCAPSRPGTYSVAPVCAPIRTHKSGTLIEDAGIFFSPCNHLTLGEWEGGGWGGGSYHNLASGFSSFPALYQQASAVRRSGRAPGRRRTRRLSALSARLARPLRAGRCTLGGPCIPQGERMRVNARSTQMELLGARLWAPSSTSAPLGGRELQDDVVTEDSLVTSQWKIRTSGRQKLPLSVCS